MADIPKEIDPELMSSPAGNELVRQPRSDTTAPPATLSLAVDKARADACTTPSRSTNLTPAVCARVAAVCAVIVATNPVIDLSYCAVTNPPASVTCEAMACVAEGEVVTR